MIKSALKPITEDLRDLRLEKLGGIFGQRSYPKENFQVSTPLKIRNQGSDFTCTARTIAAILEDTEKVELSEEYQWMKTADINELDPMLMNAEGVDLRSAFKVPAEVGALEKKHAPVTFEKDGVEVCINPERYDPVLAYNALIHKQKAYFRADGRFNKDYFDSLILSLWQGRELKRALGFGIMYDPSWTFIKNGVVDNVTANQVAGHAMKGYGYEYIPPTIAPGARYDEKEYLIVQNSVGTQYGDKGIFRFSREVINTGKPFGAFMFIDLPEKRVYELKHPTILSTFRDLVYSYLRDLWS